MWAPPAPGISNRLDSYPVDKEAIPTCGDTVGDFVLGARDVVSGSQDVASRQWLYFKRRSAALFVVALGGLTVPQSSPGHGPVQ